MWHGAFADTEVSQSELKQIFLKVNQPYREKLSALFEEELTRVKDMPPQGRSYIESYPDSMKRFELKMTRNYRFITNPIREQLMVLRGALSLIR